jgi:predicted dehydrogenase
LEPEIFSKSTLLPAIEKQKDIQTIRHTICSSTGASAHHLAKKFKFESVGTDSQVVINSPEINTVIITTPHNTHSSLVTQSMLNNKHVFVEKPLCLNKAELDEIANAYKESKSCLMVGFNRRFSPHVQKMKELTHHQNTPKSVLITVNAGFIPNDHWLHEPSIGGGRVIGEGIHFIDLAQFLIGHPITNITSTFMNDAHGCHDTFTLCLSFSDGSIASINYWSNGNKTFPKERVQLFSQEKVLDLDNFRKLTGYGYPKFKEFKTSKQEKGHKEELHAFFSAIKDGSPAPIPFDEICNIHNAAFDAWEQIKNA